MNAFDEHAEATAMAIVARYEAIRDYSRAMRHYALAADWDQLIGLQTTYVGAVEALADAERDIDLSAAAARRKYALIVEIRAAEEEIRACLDQRLVELSQTMVDSRRRYDAARAYQREEHD